MFEVDNSEVEQYASDLKRFAARAYPFATKATINTAAFETRKRYQQRMREDLVLRNKWSERSVRVEQARTLVVARQEAIVGSVAGYMATQEFGGTVRAERGARKPIATSYAAGQGTDTKPRTRLPRRPNRLANIKLHRRRRAATNRIAANVVAVKEAVASGERYVFLDLGRRRGVFRIIGGKRRPKIRMVWDMSRKTVRVPRTPLLRPATMETRREIPRFYRDALLFQLRRHRILGHG
jgi:hypothetical protein